MICRIVVGITLLLLMHGASVYAGFDDFLKEALLETRRPVGSDEYAFSPGEIVIQKQTYSVYYTGRESREGTMTLLLTVFEGEKSYVLKFPQPDIIQIKDVKLKVLSFDNVLLRLQLVREPVRKYSR